MKTPAQKAIVVDLFREHAKRVRGYLGYRLRSDEDGKEAAQELFLKLWRHERDGTLKENAVGYMHVAANTIATDTQRWRALHAPERETGGLDEAEFEAVAAGTASVEDQLHWRRAMAVFVSSVKELPTTHRQIFVLHYLKGLRYPEIAKRLGIAERTIERYMATALAELHDKLEAYL